MGAASRADGRAGAGGDAGTVTGRVLEPRVLREYAMVADGERGALIGPDGSVSWMCAPRWDSPAVFSGMLEGPGRYSVTPADPWHVWGGYYEDGTLIWRSRAGRARAVDGGLALTVRLAQGEEHELVREIDGREMTDEAPDPARLWAATEEAWSQVVPDCGDLIAVADARHAYAVLRGLTSASGAMVAAATTSLPERLEAGRNYDYRYAWIRDQCYAGLAIAAHGPHPMLAGCVRFVTGRLLADGPGLMPGYRVDGEPTGGERPLRLRGYPGGSARTGNWVREQFQLDAFGEALSLYAAAAGHDLLGHEDWRAAGGPGDRGRGSAPRAGGWRADVKLFNIMVHLLSDTTRHAGHADILRGQLDGAAGINAKSAALEEHDSAFREFIEPDRGIAGVPRAKMVLVCDSAAIAALR